MKQPYTGEAGVDWRLGPGPYRFSGPPDHCVGELLLVNLSAGKLKVRALDTVAPKRLPKGSASLAPTSLSLSARLAPRTEGQVRAQLQLDPHTPPGTYQASVTVGAQTEGLQVEIEAYRELRVEPEEFLARGSGGDELTLTLTFFNEGNVDVEVDDAANIWLEERDWVRRNLGRSLNEAGEDDTTEQLAARLLHHLKASQVPPVQEHLQPAGRLVVAPGEQLSRSLSLTLPEGGPRGRFLQGFIEFDEYLIDLELYCQAARGRATGR